MQNLMSGKGDNNWADLIGMETNKLCPNKYISFCQGPFVTEGSLSLNVLVYSENDYGKNITAILCWHGRNMSRTKKLD